MMALETEIRRYDELHAELLREHEGEYAVVVGNEFVGVFATNDEAYTAGMNKAGLGPFLLRKIRAARPVIWLPSIFIRKRQDS